MELGRSQDPGQTVVITGAAGAIGRRVVALALADPEVGRAILVDPRATPSVRGSAVESHRIALSDPELKAVVGPADVVIHLGTDVDEPGPDGLPAVDVAATRAVLSAAAAAGVRRLVVLSSAMVYGAWPNNPVPLTEDAPLRPDPGYEYAGERAEVERLVAEWRNDHDGTTVAVLRPAVTVDAASETWLALSPWSARSLRASGAERASQFLHLDDLATAVDHARRSRLDGAYNVAPDGWLSADALADLAGPVGRVHLPSGWAPRLRALRSRIGFSGPPPGLAYTEHPWVVANDRLRATGWEPRLRSDEVYVEADPGGPLAAMSPRRRQELSLAGAVLMVAGSVVGAVLILRRRRRPR